LTTPHPLLDHTDLYHVGLFVDDVEAAMAYLGKRRHLAWTPVQHYVMRAWLPGAGPEEVVVNTAYSVGRPVHVELTQTLSGPLPKGGDLLVPHHLGYWCDEVMATTDQLLDSGWTMEFMGGLLDGEPTITVVRSDSGYCVELVPSDSRERVEQKLASPSPAP
jgi:hypothetical protein